MNVTVLADTHLRAAPDRPRRRWLPPAAEPYLESADVILHAGDVLDVGILDRLLSYAPLYAVLGNNDVNLVGVLPIARLVDLAGVRIGMVHDSGPVAGRARRLRRRFPDADVVVFGHSHAPVNETGEEGQLLFNPGSPTQRRAQPCHTLGQLLLEGARIVKACIVDLD
jgi:putative phosphoesterase